MSSQVVSLNTLRVLAYGSISSSYAAIGSPFASPVRLICITNNTDGDIFVSDDGVNNKLFVPKSSFKLFDLTTNKTNEASTFVFATNTQLYVKQSTSPTKGAVYVEAITGNRD